MTNEEKQEKIWDGAIRIAAGMMACSSDDSAPSWSVINSPIQSNKIARACVDLSKSILDISEE